jgi:surface protein
MKGMFHFAPLFNQPLNTWQVERVTDMSSMFHGAISFNQPLDQWNVKNVTTMSNMFWERSPDFQSAVGMLGCESSDRYVLDVQWR